MINPDLHPPALLRRLIHLRWIEVVAQIIALLIVGGFLSMPLMLPVMSGFVALLTAINLATGGWIRANKSLTHGGVLFHLLIDTAVLTGLLYLSGGSTNPFVSLLLIPLIFAASTLPTRYTLSMAAIMLAIYSGLMLFHIPLPPPHGALAMLDERIVVFTSMEVGHGLHLSGHGFGLHLLGMWLNFLLSAALISFFITRMATTLRLRDSELASAREAALVHEQIVSLGTMAAGAAHQLGTPLSTIAVVIRELELTYADDPALAAELQLLGQQVVKCKSIVSDLLTAAGHSRSESGTQIPIDQMVAEIVEQWRLIRPTARVTVSAEGPRPPPLVIGDRMLEQAILNLLDNAADASPDGVELASSWTDADYTLQILDRGPGISKEWSDKIGQPFVTSKADSGGLGIGVFLSSATIERFGGTIEIINRPDGGACTRIRLPLARPVTR